MGEMAELIWTEPALQTSMHAKLVGLDNPLAERADWFSRSLPYHRVEQVEAYPETALRPAELRRSTRRYRPLVEPPCRVIYRYDRGTERCSCSSVMRGEMRLQRADLSSVIAKTQWPDNKRAKTAKRDQPFTTDRALRPILFEAISSAKY